MNLDALAFGAHPDDVELFAGGTLAKLSAQGYATGIVDMTRGELGTRGSAAIRAREAKQAASALGIAVRENLGLTDGDVRPTTEAREEVIRVLRKYRPTLVLAHYWEDRHPDHVNTSRLVAEAAHHAGLAKIETGQDRFRPRAILYFKLPSHVMPSFVVDVTDFEPQRRAAIQCYKSQLFDASSAEPSTYLSQPDFSSYIDSIHAYYGALVGRKRGEAFYTSGVVEMPDPVDFFNRQSPLRRGA
jgi:bacillithiol biosynthesis deacetylase BshB1